MDQPSFTQADTLTTRVCRVQINIRANASVLWALLTDAAGFPHWNPTISRIEGRIAEGERLRLHVPGTKAIFTPRVSKFVPGKGMVWSNGIRPLFRGVRTFKLESLLDGSTNFVMEEQFSGLVFALFKNKMPEFGPIFEEFASGLGRKAEGLAQGEPLESLMAGE